MSLFFKSFKILDNNEKKLIYFLVLITIISMLFEVLSIGAIIPVMSGLLDQNQFLNNLDFLNQQSLLNKIFDLNIKYIFLLFALIFLIKNIVIYFTFSFRSFLLNKIAARLSKNIFSKYTLLDYEEFTKKKTAEITNVNTTIVDVYRDTLGNIILFFSEITIFLGIIFFLFLIEPKAVIILSSISLGLSYLFYYFNKNLLSDWGRKVKINRESKLQILLQSLNLIKNIKILENQNFFTEKYNFYNKKDYKYIFLQSLINNLPRHFFELLGIGILIFSVIYMVNMNFQTEDIIIILSIFGVAAYRILPGIGRITTSITLVRFYKYSIDVIYEELINSKINLNKNFFKNKDNYKFLNLKFNNVSFLRKDNNHTILQDLEFQINKGEKVGVKGLSGAGKTTFIDLICGLLKPTNGKILINDNIDITNLKSTTPIKIGYITQSIFLSNDDIISNIAFGLSPNQIKEKKIIEVMKICKLDKFIKNEKILNDISIGEGGANLSGGEKQRFGIARALYTDPDVLIFDEFTSSIDSETEKEIVQNLKNIIKDKTSIFVSHKDSIFAHCDKIYEIKNKKIFQIKELNKT